ncbi:hypothetical protein PORY_000489 [Pneumocystis oryctolagi]|uniref:Uncharacterized protein n=1 Tax=Pneumocystis oryctolagi TaxID=42067 RepID=A0ACB7CFP4_9ASCO|nr:hypothetical protein PORY_000489 [Pneumocystis oryctolagi]
MNEKEVFDEKIERSEEGLEEDECVFLYGLSPAMIEAKRGYAVSITFKKMPDPLNGYLWNVDPWSGTMFVFERGDKDMATMWVVMSDAIFSITCKF